MINEYEILAIRVESIYHTLGEVSDQRGISLITGPDDISFHNENTGETSRQISRTSLINLEPLDLVRVIVGLYTDMGCNCED